MAGTVRVPTARDGAGALVRLADIARPRGHAIWIAALALSCAAVVVSIAALHGPSLFAPLAAWSGYRKDFTAFYAASAMIGSGSGSAIYETQVIAGYESHFVGHPVGDYGYMAYLNPPIFAAALTPLTFLSFEHAYQTWTAFNFVLLAIDVWMLWRITASLSARARVLLTLGFVTFLPVADGLLLGQFSLVLLTAWMGAFLLLRAGRDTWAGGTLALLLLKPEMLLPPLLLLAIKRRWRVFAGFAPLAGAAAAVSVGVVGWSAAVGYPAYVLGSARWASNATKSNAMYNWNGIVAMVWHQPAAVPVAAAIVALLSIASLVAVCYAWRGRLAPRSRRFALQWAALTVVTVLVDPQLHLQDTVLLALPAVALYADASPRERPLYGWLLAGAWAILMLGPLPNQRLHVNVFALYLVAAGLLIAYRLQARWRLAGMRAVPLTLRR